MIMRNKRDKVYVSPRELTNQTDDGGGGVSGNIKKLSLLEEAHCND